MTTTAMKPRAEFTIRPADAKDITLIAKLAHNIWPAAYQGILTDEQIENMLMLIYSHENLKREMHDGHRFWIASSGGKELAFASGYREGDTAWVKKIYVHPHNKGMGLGRALIGVIEQSFAPVREVRLLVNPNNHPAMLFYRHIGFTEVGRKPVKMGDFHFEDHIFARPVKE